MEPTLYSHNILLTERITARFHQPSRGDIVIAVSPIDPEQFICKRVVALPGDRIILAKTPELENYVNLLDTDNENDVSTKTENKNKSKDNTDDSSLGVIKNIPRGYVWVEGDNITNSADSRYYGPLPIGLIKSRAICRVWPLNDLKLL